MFDQIYKLKFKGAAFSNDTVLQLFDNPKERMCLMYGKNGTGKSTISNAVEKAKGMDIPDILYASFLDKNDVSITIPPGEAEHCIYVFGEDYIQKNVMLKEDGLSTIVMFGQQVDLENQIIVAKNEYEQAEALKNQQEEVCKKYTNRTSLLAPAYYISKMNLSLSGDSHWAGRERQISDARRNTSVNDDTYKTIIDKVPTLSEDEVGVQYQLKYNLLLQAKAGTEKITVKVNANINVPEREHTILDLLAQTIEKPELSKREEYLLSLIEVGNIAQLDDMTTAFTDETVEQCPFCLQPVTAEYRVGLIESIKKVLSRQVEEHKNALLSVKLSVISLDFQPFNKLNSEILKRCELLLKELNEAIEKCNYVIQQKHDRPFNPITGVSFDINDKVAKLIEALTELETARKEYNAPFDNVSKLQNELKTLNKYMAYYEIIEHYNSFTAQSAEKRNEDGKLATLLSAAGDKKIAVDELMQQKRNVRIAVDIINSSLRYVFFSRNRLEIKVENEVYSLLSNGVSVKPSNVSVGERNIIALCYFFAEMLSNLEAENGYSKEMFIVIDDPISSFDLENRVGIMSFLKTQLNNVMCGNQNTKILIMTHDLPAVFDLEKLFGEIRDAVKRKFSTESCNYQLLELSSKNLLDFKYKKRHEYSELLKMVYTYANGGAAEYEMTIGNVMRRTLETFATFVYRKGIDTISCDETILDSLGAPEYKSYFQNLMYRLVLNGESHMEERTRAIIDADFFAVLSSGEKLRTSKDIICFLYLLNPTHVIAHLDGITDTESNINSWCSNILSFDQS